MEAVKYKKDENGNKYIESNIVLYLEKEIEYSPDMSEKQRGQIERKNNRIRQRNERRISSITDALNSSFANSTNEEGENVTFVFNIIPTEKDNPYADSPASINADAFNNGIDADTPQKVFYDGGYGKAAAVVISLASAGAYLGSATGSLVKLSSWDKDTFSHEIGHTLGLSHPDGGGISGLMHYPPERLTPEEVTTIWNNSSLVL